MLSDVDLAKREIYVSPKIAKTRAIRHIPFGVTILREGKAIELDPISSWLACCPPPENGKVRPPGATKRFRKLRGLAGISAWPNNATRHSFASYFFDATDNAPLTSSRLGQADKDVLFEHYRALVRKGAGVDYFSLLPE